MFYFFFIGLICSNTRGTNTVDCPSLVHYAKVEPRSLTPLLLYLCSVPENEFLDLGIKLSF